MTERLLQFLWQFQYFDKQDIRTIDDEPVAIIFAGHHNPNQGPDFSNAIIKIANTTWAGAVELHVHTSGWHQHQHQHDANYKNVILHVVWKHDDWTNDIPVLELHSRVSRILLERFEKIMGASSFIPCEKIIEGVNDLTWHSWKERMVIERLLRKSAAITYDLEQNNYHWEETFWWLLAKNFGAKVNASTFEAIARSIPLLLLAKHKTRIHQVEALLFGQAGLLEREFAEDYPRMLKKEYQFLRKKYRLSPVHEPIHFLRMRPGNFPTIRLAQLAVLITQSVHLFSKLKEMNPSKQSHQWLNVTANDYWHYHYRFDEITVYKQKSLGDDMKANIIINTVAPMLFAYGEYHSEHHYKEKAIQWLGAAHPESNAITRGFTLLGIANKNAFDSQGLIELKNEYCNRLRCLECAIGNGILKKG